MDLTTSGTATLVIRIGEARFLTDPVFDEAGTAYDFRPWFAPRSWFATEKRYVTPESPASLGSFDARPSEPLIITPTTSTWPGARSSPTGRAIIEIVRPVPSARRLARPAATKGRAGPRPRARQARPSGSRLERTRVGPATVTTIVARHGPGYAPQATR